MTRPLRLLYANAWYHVMNRGAAKVTTFHDREDYQVFINIFNRLHSHYRFEIHSYCLMPNHYHILIRTLLPNLSCGMQYLNGVYTCYYNHKYKKDGSLFRGRYKAILIDAENYLLRVSRYIHLNPVKAYLAKRPSKYRWSSYQFYTRHTQPPAWLKTEEILSRFGIKQQKNTYSLFVIEKTDQELELFYRRTRLLPILGSDSFCKQIGDIVLTKMLPLSGVPDQKRVYIAPDLPSICMIVAKYYCVSLESLYLVKRKEGNAPRQMAIYLAAELTNFKFVFIATYFRDISTAGISQVVFRINKLKIGNPAVVSDITRISNQIQGIDAG